MRLVFLVLWTFGFSCLANFLNGDLSVHLTSPMVISDEDVARVESELWQNYLSKANLDEERKKQHIANALTLGNKTMRFSLERRGSPSAAGYPVYIALHGGGTAPAYVNDRQWHHMQVYYRDSVKNGLYIAVRGISDTWDLHFQEESYPLYDRLIENLIAYENADPNRIYLLGFSAGGDGVYQITPRMPDRFAAANMSAGHHNWIKFDNLLNTPFLLQVGELDSMYGRNRVAAENFINLKSLQNEHGGYIHDLFMHHNFYHNGWYDNDENERAQPVIGDPEAWLKNNNRSQISKNTNAVAWLTNHRRNALPKKLIWDLSTRALLRDHSFGLNYLDQNLALTKNQNLFYWLALDQENLTEGRIEAEIISEENAILLNRVEGIRELRLLLHRNLFDFKRPIKVYYNQEVIAEIEPRLEAQVMAKTLAERGDPSFMFHSEILVTIPDRNRITKKASHFTYCSKDRCSLRSADDFQRDRDFPLDIYYTCKNDYHYALTFDDGPSENVPALLEILDRHKIPATFFVLGQNLQNAENQALVRDAHLRGHEIANHSFSHPSLIALDKNQIINELMRTQEAIVKLIGKNKRTLLASSILRPPFGDIDDRVQKVVRELHFKTVRWNSDRYDWELASEQSDIIRERIYRHIDFIDSLSPALTVNRSIIDVNHDRSHATLSALEEMIPKIKEAGFRFVTLTECLGLKKAINPGALHEVQG